MRDASSSEKSIVFEEWSLLAFEAEEGNLRKESGTEKRAGGTKRLSNWLLVILWRGSGEPKRKGSL